MISLRCMLIRLGNVSVFFRCGRDERDCLCVVDGWARFISFEGIDWWGGYKNLYRSMRALPFSEVLLHLMI